MLQNAFAVWGNPARGAYATPHTLVISHSRPNVNSPDQLTQAGALPQLAFQVSETFAVFNCGLFS